MNMLIGVLCEVVSAVAATEKETILVAFTKAQLEKVWEEIAGDIEHGEIDKEQFSMILESMDACRALEEAGVDPIGLVDNIDFIFAGDDEDDIGNAKEKKLTFGDFVALVLTLRGSNLATVKDVVDLRKHLNMSIHKLRQELRTVLGGPSDTKMIGHVSSTASMGRKRWGLATAAMLEVSKTTSFNNIAGSAELQRTDAKNVGKGLESGLERGAEVLAMELEHPKNGIAVGGESKLVVEKSKHPEPSDVEGLAPRRWEHSKPDLAGDNVGTKQRQVRSPQEQPRPLQQQPRAQNIIKRSKARRGVARSTPSTTPTTSRHSLISDSS